MLYDNVGISKHRKYINSKYKLHCDNVADNYADIVFSLWFCTNSQLLFLFVFTSIYLEIYLSRQPLHQSQNSDVFNLVCYPSIPSHRHSFLSFSSVGMNYQTMFSFQSLQYLKSSQKTLHKMSVSLHGQTVPELAHRHQRFRTIKMEKKS